MAEGPRRRLRLVIALLVGLVILIVVQLGQLQIIDHAFYQEWADEQQYQSIVMAEAPRGVIRDRNGHLLAGNAVVYSIEAAPPYVLDAGAVAAELGAILHLPAAQIQRSLEERDENDQLLWWVRIAYPVTKEVGEQIADLRLPGITVWPHWTRAYPEGRLASHTLGFCTVELTGFYGVEGFQDDLLRPEPARWEGPVDSDSEQIPWAVAPIVLPEPGTDLVLTLDRTIQALAEEELARSVYEFQAEGGTIIVMDPHTFEILALASLPNYDPGRYVEFYGAGQLPFEDPAVSMQYEPGSVFKIVTVAAALDMGLVTPESTYYDDEFEVGGQEILNASRQHYGWQSVTDILVKSLNVGAAHLSTEMGAGEFYEYVYRFGFGRITEVGLAGEVAGQVWTPSDFEHWHDSNLGTNAFGQGLAVTPLQMAAAVATVANDGTRLRPHIVLQRVEPDGTVLNHQPVIEAEVISSHTARQLQEMLVQVVEEGVPNAQVPGYRVAGKTGTAQIPIPGGYDQEGTIASFGGFGPVPDPRFVILVKLDRPGTSDWAADTAAASFSRLAERLFVVMGVPPETATIAEAVR